MTANLLSMRPITRLSFSEMLADTNDLIGEHKKFWAQFFFVYYVPLAIIQSFITADAQEIVQLAVQGDFEEILSISEEFQDFQIVSWLLGLVTMYFFCVNAWAVFRQWGGEPYSWSEILRASLKKWPWVLATGLLLIILLIVPFLAFIIPGIFLLVCWSMSLYLVVFLDLTFLDAIKASYNMVIQNWWTVFLLFFIAVLITAFLGIILSTILFWAPNMVSFVLSTAVGAYFSVFYVVMFLHVYNYTYPPQNDEDEFILKTDDLASRS